MPARPAKVAPSHLWALLAGCALAAGLLIAPNTSQAADGVTTNATSGETLQGQDTAAAVAAIEAQATGGVKQISAGGRFACATTGDGSVFCWGDNEYGQLGDGTFGSFEPRPVRVLAGEQSDGEFFSGAQQVSAGRYHACAVDQSNTVFCWGDRQQLGVGTSGGSQTTPIKVSTQTVSSEGVRPGSFPQGNIIEISAGWQVTCARAALNGGIAYCWGTLVGSTYPGQGLPWLVAGNNFNNNNVSTVSAGGTHACLAQDGGAWCLGTNTKGELGSGTSGNDAQGLTRVVSGDQPQQPESGYLENVTAISAGETVKKNASDTPGGHTCAITGQSPQAEVYCWGGNVFGQLGLGPRNSIPGTPQKVADANGFINATARDISAGAGHTCAISGSAESQAAYCWGNGSDGALGTGSSNNSDSAVPVQTVGGLTPTREISAGVDFTCAVGISDGAFCFGANARGQLGIGTEKGPDTRSEAGDETRCIKANYCSLSPIAVAGQVRVVPSPVQINDTRTGRSRDKTVTLKSAFLASEASVSVDVTAGDVRTFTYQPGTGCNKSGDVLILTDTACEGEIRFTPKQPGQNSATVQLEPTDYPYADTEFLVTGLGIGNSNGPLVSAPPVDFGQVNTFTEVTKNAKIENIGNQPLVITNARISSDPDDEFAAPDSKNKCLDRQIQPGKTCTIKVQFFPRSSDTSVALLKLKSNAEGSATVGLTGVGVSQGSGAKLGPVRKLSVPTKKLTSNRALVRWKKPKTNLPVTDYETRIKKCSQRNNGWNCKKPSWKKWVNKDPRPNLNGWISHTYKLLKAQQRYKVQVRALSNDIVGKKSAITFTPGNRGIPTRPANG